MEDMESRNKGFERGASYGGHIPSEAREVIADVLLASLCKDGDYPAYNEEQMNRRRKRSTRAEEHFIALSVDRSMSHGTTGEKVVDFQGLAQNERTAWEMFSAGYRASEIARRLGVSRPTAVRLLKRTARLIAAYKFSFLGLEDVYRTEVHRWLYRRPTHCPEQPCRQLGYCKYSGQI